MSYVYFPNIRILLTISSIITFSKPNTDENSQIPKKILLLLCGYFVRSYFAIRNAICLRLVIIFLLIEALRITIIRFNNPIAGLKRLINSQFTFAYSVSLATSRFTSKFLKFNQHKAWIKNSVILLIPENNSVKNQSHLFQTHFVHNCEVHKSMKWNEKFNCCNNEKVLIQVWELVQFRIQLPN